MSKRKRPPRSARSRISSSRNSASPSRMQTGGRSAPVPGRSFWIYGIHAVAAALNNKDRKKHRLLLSKGAVDSLRQELHAADNLPVDAELADRSDLDKLLDEGAVHQGACLLVDPLPELDIDDLVSSKSKADQGTVVVLDQASDPRNIGSVLRSARAFRADALVIQDRNAPHETGVMAKAASGALETVPVVRVNNLVRALWKLKDADFWCYGLDGHSDTEIGGVDAPPKSVIILGAEGKGLRRLTRETCDHLIKIPIDPTAESLNLSNAAAIALYEFSKRERKK